MAYPTLEHLAASKDSVDTEEFGLKTEGNVELIREGKIFSELIMQGSGRVNERMQILDGEGVINYPYIVPVGFAIDGYKDLDNSKLKESLTNFLKYLDAPFPFLVRSSSKNEEPGQNKTLPLVYNGENNLEFFQKFLNAVNEVRGENNIPVLVQKMAGTVSNLYTDKSGIVRTYAQPAENTSPFFGYYDEGFIGRSHSHMDPSLGIIVGCNGLTSKIAGKHDEGIVLEFDKKGFINIFCIGKDYREHHHGNYSQDFADLLDLTTGEINSYKIPGFPISRMRGRNHEGIIDVPDYIATYAKRISFLLSYFSNKFGRPVEIEGTINEGTLNLYQLTKSHFLPEILKEVIPHPNAIADGKDAVIGSMKFSGNILVYDANREGSKQAAFEQLKTLQNTSPLLIISNEFPDDLLKEVQEKSYVIIGNKEHFHDYFNFKEKYTFKKGTEEFNEYFVDHLTAFLSETLYKRTKNGDKAIALTDHIAAICVPLYSEYCKNKFSDTSNLKIDVAHDVYLLKNATFEAAKGNYQIFFNK